MDRAWHVPRIGVDLAFMLCDYARETGILSALIRYFCTPETLNSSQLSSPTKTQSDSDMLKTQESHGKIIAEYGAIFTPSSILSTTLLLQRTRQARQLPLQRLARWKSLSNNASNSTTKCASPQVSHWKLSCRRTIENTLHDAKSWNHYCKPASHT